MCYTKRANGRTRINLHYVLENSKNKIMGGYVRTNSSFNNFHVVNDYDELSKRIDEMEKNINWIQYLLTVNKQRFEAIEYKINFNAIRRRNSFS